MPSGSPSAARDRRESGSRRQRRLTSEDSSDDDDGDPYAVVEQGRATAASTSRQALAQLSSGAFTSSTDSQSSAQVEDVFHLNSHPVAGPEDGFVLVAQEADLLPDDVAAQRRDAQITWSGSTHDGKRVNIKTDRYDVLHLLSTLPAGATLIDAGTRSVPIARNASVAEMDDLPSDTEDVFFLEADEVEVYRRQKHMKQLEAHRQARISTLKAQDEAEEDDEEETRHASSGKPITAKPAPITQDQLDLMRRTAHALRDATNRAALEMRILANHGNDARFAFLRRRQNGASDATDPVDHVWQQLLAGKTLTLSEANGAASHAVLPKVPQSAALVEYDSSSGSEEEEVTKVATQEDPEARRKRKLALAHEWSRKRQAQKSAQPVTSTTDA